jgi:hypothetical protein
MLTISLSLSLSLSLNDHGHHNQTFNCNHNDANDLVKYLLFDQTSFFRNGVIPAFDQ